MDNLPELPPYHEWGDEDFDWDGLNNAGRYIAQYCRRYGRIIVFWKEKYGTLRTDVYFSHILYKDESILIRYINKLIFKYQAFIYRKAYINAVKRYPHLKLELIVDMYYPELVPEFNEIYNKYWR